MAEESSEKIRTFSIGFHEKSFDESKAAMRFAKELKSEHNQFMFDSKECLKLIPNIANLVDEPLSDASILPTYFLSNFASKQVKVCLGGDGGDELFAGYQIFPVHCSLMKNSLGILPGFAFFLSGAGRARFFIELTEMGQALGNFTL